MVGPNQEAMRTREANRKHRAKNQIGFFVFVFASLASLLPSSYAEVIDRIVAVVGGRIVTLSDVREERDVRTRLGEKDIPDDKTLARDLVDNYLVERQLDDYPNADATDAEVNDRLQLTNDKTSASAAVQKGVRLRIRMQKFFEIKFGKSVQPTDEQVRQYYMEIFVPAARARGLDPIPSLADPEMANAVRDNLIQESLHREATDWLDTIRKRSNIEFFD